MTISTILRRNTGKAAMLAGVAALAMLTSTVAQAQTAANGAPEEIIVTAQRRAERLQDVPISISVATAASLERGAVANVRDLSSITPGMLTAGQGANIIPSIRGVSSAQTDPGNDANVSLYVDGIYQPDQLANAMDLPDVSRIEVLKGPQGTLFGRNATGGAIRIFTREPTMDGFKGSLDVGYGNYNHASIKGFIGGPIVDGKLAASISGSFERIDSYTYNVALGTKSEDTKGKSARVKLLFTPSDQITLEVIGSYAYRNCGECTAYTAINGVANTVAKTFPGGPGIIPLGPYTYASNSPATVKAQIYTTALRATYAANIGEFVSTTSYNAVKSFYQNDEDSSTRDILMYPIYKRETTFNEELIFNSKKFNQFRLTAGAFYYGDTGRYDPLGLEGITFGGYAEVFSKQRTDAYAGFGELTWEPTDRISVIGGVRYSHEKRSAEGTFVFGQVPRPPESGFSPIGVPVAFNSTTPRASIRYTFTDAGDNAYFTFSQGFKSGGFNIAASQATPFQPEHLTAYEIGIKTAPSRMLSANIAGFYYNYTNQQVMAAVGNFNVTANAASSRIYGADADIIAHLTPELTLTGGVEVLDAKYKAYPGAITNAPILNPDGTNCFCGNNTAIVDLSGGRLPFSPKVTFSISAEYKKDVSIGLFDFSANLFHSGAYSFQSRALVLNPAYTTLALRASFQPTNSNFTFYAWGKNVTNARWFQAELEQNAGDQANYTRPATYGAGVKYDF